MAPDADNLEIPISTLAVPDPSSKRVIRHKLDRLIILNSIILIACSVTSFGRIYMNVVRARNKRAHDRWGYFAFEIIVLAMGLMNAVFGLTLAIYERGKYRDGKMNTRLINLIHLILNIICAFLFLLFFVIEFIRWCAGLLNNDELRNGVRLAVIIFALLIGLCQIACAIENRILAWSPKYRYSRFVLCFSSTILMAISIASIAINVQVRHLQQGTRPSGDVPLWSYTTLQASSIYTLVCGLVGITLTFVCGRKEIGPNQFRKRLRQYFNILCLVGLALVIVFSVILLSYHKKSADRRKLLDVSTLTRSDLILSAVQCILLLISTRSLSRLVRALRPGRNDLTIERIRLSQTSPVYFAHWVAAIDAFDCTPEGMTGDAALQLMKAYENGQLENIECAVLRVARSGRRVPISHSQWDDTEALVLLTIVHNYDVLSTTHFNGFWGTALKRTLGTENCSKHFRPLLFRLGLIGFQWPFRTSVFFTAPHPDPVTRAANVLETIIDWNEMQKSKTRCDVLLLPSLSTELIAKAISLAGFFPSFLPPTHLVDLRPHRGKTWSEYMKTLKKGNRRPYIQQFLTKGGTIEEVHDISPPEVGKTVCEQWENIARIRRANKEPPTLLKPSVEYISAMGNAMNESYRSVVFLRFNNEVIASSVIYKFPQKLVTTDIQGLTHEKARPLKAYFVMLQWVIKEALDKKYDFVDFGPTTPGPKLDLGCKSVPLKVGGYAGNPILAFGIQQACGTLDAIHQKRNDQQPAPPNQGEKEQDEPQPDTQPSTSNPKAAPQNPPKKQKQKQIKNVEKPTDINRSQVHTPEASSGTTDTEVKKTNPRKKKAQVVSNGDNQPRQNVSKNEQSIDETKEKQPVNESQSPESTKSDDSTAQETRNSDDPQSDALLQHDNNERLDVSSDFVYL